MTAKGRDLFPVMVALRQWGEQHLFAPGEPHSSLIERDSGRKITLTVQTEDGRPIDAEGAMILKVPETEKQP